MIGLEDQMCLFESGRFRQVYSVVHIVLLVVSCIALKFTISGNNYYVLLVVCKFKIITL